MIPDHVKPLQPMPRASFYLRDDRVDFLIRTIDWYRTPSIQRYLLNMASWQMCWLDECTEMRSYNFDSWGFLRFLWELIDEAPGLAAREAYEMWGDLHTSFTITHTQRNAAGEEVQLLGDDPCDAANFLDLNPGVKVPDFFTDPLDSIDGGGVG